MSDRLTTGANVTLDATGAGAATLGPGRAGERWSVTRYTTRGSSTVEPALEVYRGPGMIDSTKRGNDDVSEMTAELILWAGESITFRYTGGTPGASMTVYVEGDADHGAS